MFKIYSFCTCASPFLHANRNKLNVRLTHLKTNYAIERAYVSHALCKKRIQHRCFPVNITKLLRTAFFLEHLWWLFFVTSHFQFLELFTPINDDSWDDSLDCGNLKYGITTTSKKTNEVKRMFS